MKAFVFLPIQTTSKFRNGHIADLRETSSNPILRSFGFINALPIIIIIMRMLPLGLTI